MRSLPESTTNRSLTVSSATPCGLHNVAAAGDAELPKLHAIDAMLSAWPNTRSAVVSPLPAIAVVVRGVLNSSTRS
jgi:hypothetical protein